MKILLFGIAKEIAGKSVLDASEFSEAKNVGELKKVFKERYPEASKLSSLAIAVNEEYAEDDHKISTGDEVAIIPPVSGG
ncbi:molybdopterin converting factor subunit 1 [Aequorivita echinoideorum]|uniref:Molybdopterin synthase sulfur carrier subunit n=1 Tax=Aequorivita echinoideorum TaxID=1549647 RepID=A0ABS5S6V2_9FLAO|nr:molybdopterin converting factor subunit 1 [Aequorivita echinoideorum]MBT0608112.1 molybdopterin converting factor subunit 1 [Aequorivita echinoideorum]